MSIGIIVPWIIQGSLLVLVTWIVIKIVSFVRNFNKRFAAVSKLENLPRHWLWGTIPKIREIGRHNVQKYLTEETIKRGCKSLVMWRGFFMPSVIVTHSKTVGEILRTAEPKNRSYKAGYTLSIPWLGDGLLISGGKKWERNRKLLTPAFHFKVLQPYMKLYNDAVDVLSSKFDKSADTGDSFEVFDPMALCTLDVMLRCAFSYDGQIQDKGSMHPYVQAVKRLAYLVAERSLKPLLYFECLYDMTTEGKEFRQHCDYVHQFADEIIEKRQRALLTDPDLVRKTHLDFLDILLEARDENGVGFSKLDMRAEVDTFLFEGHDTTASAASWAVYALAKNPYVQEKVYQEVHSILGEETYVKWEDLSKLQYTSMFIKEVMRMYSPVPAIGRELTQPMVIDGVELPAGMVVAVSIYAMHHNPDVWDNPETFRPERFAEDKFATRDPYSFVPFSAGPRNCIGQTFALNEEKVIVSRLVNRFRVVLDEGHEPSMVPELIMRSRNGIKIKIYSRS